MSNGDESDEHNEALMKEKIDEHHDAYIQWVIDKIEDPDYDEYPILIDSERVVYPSGANELMVIRTLKAAIEFIKRSAGID